MPQVQTLRTPKLADLLYVAAEANLSEHRDCSAPSDFHWKVLKCRMLIFSESSILASPDYGDIRRIHVVFPNRPEYRVKLSSLFSKFILAQKAEPKEVTCLVYQSCLRYTIIARLAPTWNLLGKYYVNNRDFLTTAGPQRAIQCSLYVTEEKIEFHFKVVKITLITSHRPTIGYWVRVLPSLNKAVVEDVHNQLAATDSFGSYKALKRHWKNIHGYRLPDEESAWYCSIRFWRGDCLTYPACCVTSSWPIVVPVPREEETSGEMNETQAVSLCTPTPASRKRLVTSIQGVACESDTAHAVSLATTSDPFVLKRKRK